MHVCAFATVKDERTHKAGATLFSLEERRHGSWSKRHQQRPVQGARLERAGGAKGNRLLTAPTWQPATLSADVAGPREETAVREARVLVCV